MNINKISPFNIIYPFIKGILKDGKKVAEPSVATKKTLPELVDAFIKQ